MDTLTAPRKWRVTVLISGSGNYHPTRAQTTPKKAHTHPVSSSTGSNLAALLAALPSTLSNCSIVHVLSSKSTAYGLTRASSHDPPIPSSIFSLVTWKRLHPLSENPRAEYDLELARRVKETKPDLVVLAGWMLILSEGFLESLRRDWEEEEVGTTTTTMTATGGEEGIQSLPTPGGSPYSTSPSTRRPKKGDPIPIINLHPALPGTFPGAHAISDAYNAFNSPPPSTSSSASPNPTTPTPAPSRITKTGIMIHRVIPLLDAGEPVIVKEVELREGESLQGLEGRIHEVEHVAIVEAVGKVVGMLKDGSWWG